MNLKHLPLVTLALALLGCADVNNKQPSLEETMKQNRFNVAISSPDLSSYHRASTLVVSCIDFRLRDETAQLFNNILSLKDKYDEVVFPGAALALTLDKTDNAHWTKTLEDFIGITEKLHNVENVVFIDHRDCGAYKIIKGKDHTETKEKETQTHKAVFDDVRRIMKEKFPKLKVYTLLMGLDGVVENIE